MTAQLINLSAARRFLPPPGVRQRFDEHAGVGSQVPIPAAARGSPLLLTTSKAPLHSQAEVTAYLARRARERFYRDLTLGLAWAGLIASLIGAIVFGGPP
jgi:hypothetical protein